MSAVKKNVFVFEKMNIIFSWVFIKIPLYLLKFDYDYRVTIKHSICTNSHILILTLCE